jgi:hypothetical protein
MPGLCVEVNLRYHGNHPQVRPLNTIHTYGLSPITGSGYALTPSLGSCGGGVEQRGFVDLNLKPSSSFFVTWRVKIYIRIITSGDR